MCGISGMVCASGGGGGFGSFSDERAARWRDMLSRRGPDGAGLWRHKNAMLLHRRLSVIDPTPAGAQPMVLEENGTPRFAITYNGEIYNDAELRRELAARGVVFRSSCDTETVLHALAVWGPRGLSRLRGMFALALFDCRENTLLLARDPLGMKPLAFHVGERAVVFASEAWAVAEHPDVPKRPDPFMCAAYLTTIRTQLGNRTMYDGVLTLRPGQSALCDLSGERPVVGIIDHASTASAFTPSSIRGAVMKDGGEALVREVVTDSVRRHLRSDVPTCCLLSGGLDSSVVASIARRGTDLLRTYCAGAALPCDCRDAASVSDFAFAQKVAAHLGTSHSEARITREAFNERWAWMVGELGVPLSTPNEVAIWSVADRLRKDGCVVTLSGEGADELFAGYEGPMRAAWACAHAVAEGAAVSPAEIEMNEAAWVPPDAWGAVLEEGVLRGAGGPEAMPAWYREEFARSLADCGGEYSVQSHLRFHQRVNLTGLLQRLDTATMLAGVEGRTPLADIEVMALANALPMESKCVVEEMVGVGVGDSGALRSAGTPPSVARGAQSGGPRELGEIRTKIVLRGAFERDLPREIVERPKASFPMPFQRWMDEKAATVLGGPAAKQVFTDAARATVVQQPEQLWRLTWPMTNLAMWLERF